MARKKLPLPRNIRRAAVLSALVKHDWDCHAAAAATGERLRYVQLRKLRYDTGFGSNDSPRCGRPRALTQQQVETAAILLAEQQSIPKVTRHLVEAHGAPPTLSRSTVHRAIVGSMAAVLPTSQPLISRKSCLAREAFAQHHQEQGTDWRKVVALDSSIFYLNGCNPRQKVWSPVGVKPVISKPNRSQKIHVYGAICATGKTKLMYVTGTSGMHSLYKDGRGKQLQGFGGEDMADLLRDRLVPAVQQLGVAGWMLLMDNAPAHTAHVTQQYIANTNISVLPSWPANSPDLNPIENVWGMIKKQVYGSHYTSLAELKAAVEAAWEAIPVHTLQNLMSSMPRRLQRVLQLKGGYTGYELPCTL